MLNAAISGVDDQGITGQAGGTVFNIGATYCQEITGVMKHLIAARKLQKAKFALIYQDDDFGADVKCGYDAALKAAGLSSAIDVP